MSKILPQDPTQAVKQLIKMTDGLIRMMDTEGRSMATNDAINFTVSEEDKGRAAQVYAQAGQEFADRANEFAFIEDKALIDQLMAAQVRLKEVAERNNKNISKVPGFTTPANDEEQS